MIDTALAQHITAHFPFEPTPQQQEAVQAFARFMVQSEPSVFVLRGHAGTGKTLLAGVIVQTMKSLSLKSFLLAPTGRAAKVFSGNSNGVPAYTIHRKIYREKSFDGVEGSYALNDNLHTDTLFIVDEASMIDNQSHDNNHFGSGCLLDDLMQFVFSGRGCKLMLIGDTAQLPPIGRTFSPALHIPYLKKYHLPVYLAELDTIVRQQQDSGILYNATKIRECLDYDLIDQFPQIKFEGFHDIVRVQGGELVEAIQDSYDDVGEEETMIITRSNKDVLTFNRGIKSQVLYHEDPLVVGDWIMVVKNNYYWTEEQKAPFPYLANGDRAKVLSVYNTYELAEFRFADVCIQLPDYDNFELNATVLLNVLDTEQTGLSLQQTNRLFQCLKEENYEKLTRKRELINAVRHDSLYNALQVKHAYAVTCHKAQGGQWKNVFLHQGYITQDMMGVDYLRWLYTAMTRAKEKLFFVNWPAAQSDIDLD